MAMTRRKKAEDALLDALARGATATQAAEMAGVHRRTVQRRLADPEFKQRLRAIQADQIQSTASLLAAASAGSVKTLVLLQNSSMPASARFSAARAILDLVPRWGQGSSGFVTRQPDSAHKCLDHFPGLIDDCRVGKNCVAFSPTAVRRGNPRQASASSLTALAPGGKNLVPGARCKSELYCAWAPYRHPAGSILC
jgi:hypothetical protein